MHTKTPFVTAVAVGVLALGIAASSVAFSVANAFFIRPMPIEEPERFVRVYRQAAPEESFPISYPEYRDIRALTNVFAGAIAEAPAPLIMGGADAPERAWGEIVSDDYFLQLGVTAVLGRVFSGAEDAVVLSNRLWTRRFGSDPSVLGRALQIEGRPYYVVGVAPETFRGTILGFTSDLWIPASAPSTRSATSPMADDTTDRASRDYFVMAKLAPGISIEQARPALASLASRLEREYPDTSRGIRFAAMSESGGRFPIVRATVVGFSMLTVAVALVVTIIASINIAGVLLARAAVRRSEMGVRLALGASRGRVISQLLTESAALSVLAGGLGILLAWWVTTFISGFQVTIARGASASIDVGLDYRVLAITAALTMATGVLCGLTPAVDASKASLMAVLRDGAKGDRGRQPWSRRLLLAAQVAVSMVLLAGGGLFLRSLQHAREVDLGFDPANVVEAVVDVRARRYSQEEGNRFWTTLLDRVRALPQTESAGLTFRPPLELGITRQALAPDGFRPLDGDDWPTTEFSTVAPGYFHAMRIPIVDGRDFDGDDDTGRPTVVIVNDVLAERFWPGASAAGRYLINPGGERLEVVGVARRSKYFSIGEAPTAYVYFPLAQSDARSMTLVARGTGDLRAFQQAIRATVRGLDPSAPVDLVMLSSRVDLALAPATGGASAFVIISVLALALTSLGLFGAVAQTVGRRTYEIGVRRALGAPNRAVARLVLFDTLVLIGGGLGIGIVTAIAASRYLAGLLYDVSAADPIVFGVTLALLMSVSLLATALPTYRALRINAAAALRYE